MRVEFRLSGSGGQGLLLAGIVLAEAAIEDGKNAIQTQSYGPEARGGSSKAEVIISDEDIDYPKATDPDYLLALTDDAYRTYGPLMKKGVIITDTSVKLDSSIKAKTIALPILQTAEEVIGKKVVANIVALGALAGISGIVSEKALKQSVLSRVPKGTGELNMNALKAGLELAKNA
jgi:2-oxoglutarate ferredoxin oxidoreductase subunit gamma